MATKKKLKPRPSAKRRRARRDPSDHTRHSPPRKIDPEALPYKAAFTVDEFCFRNGEISRQTFWLWRRAGTAPDVIVAGGRRLITREAEQAWLASRPIAKLSTPAANDAAPRSPSVSA